MVFFIKSFCLILEKQYSIIVPYTQGYYIYNILKN